MAALLRSLARNRAYTVAAACSIALAVGANAAIFSIVNALWLRPLPVEDPGRVVVPYRPVVHSDSGEVLDFFTASGAQALRGLNAFSAVSFELHTGGHMAMWEPVVRLRDSDRTLATAIVDASFFKTLGVRVRGRSFAEADEREGAEIAGVVSETLWRQTLGADPLAIGGMLETTRDPIRIVGIAPAGFRGPRVGQPRDLWITRAALGRLSDIGGADIERFMPVTVYARIRPGVSIELAEAQARTVLDRRTTLRSLDRLTFSLRSAKELTSQTAVLRVLWLAAALVLLLGCANLAVLVVARSEARRQELALRRCLGATTRALAGAAIAESLAICLLGLTAGLVVRRWLLAAISEFEIPSGVAIGALDAGLDWRVVAFSAAVAIATTGLASLAAVQTLRRTALSPVLAGTAATSARATVRFRQTLLAVHVALCTAVLAAGFGLGFRVRAAMHTELGYDSAHLLFVSLRPRVAPYDTPGGAGEARLQADLQRALEEVRAVPAVRSAAIGFQLLGGSQTGAEITLRGADQEVRLPVATRRVAPGFLTVAGARFLQGRDLSEQDRVHAVGPMDVVKRKAEAASKGTRYLPPDKRPFAVVDTRLSETLWPGEAAIGRTFVTAASGVAYEVVGVIAPIRLGTSGADVANLFEIDVPDDMAVIRPHHFLVRVDGDAAAARAATTEALRRVFPDPLHLSVRDTRSLIREERARERLGALVFSWFGAATGLLGLVGVYGLVAFILLRHRRELGIRAALGAGALRLLAVVSMRTVVPTLAGAALGIVLALVVSRALATIVAGVADAGSVPALLSALVLVSASVTTTLLAARSVRHLRESDLLREF